MRNFEQWFETFCDSIYSYDYFIDFAKIYKNVEKRKVELNILNSLVGVTNIEEEFDVLVKTYPSVLSCIPLLVAIRDNKILINRGNDIVRLAFNDPLISREECKVFLRETGIFDMLSSRKITNLFDYVHGIEVGLDTNARKNRNGKLMERLVEDYLIKANVDYQRQVTSDYLEKEMGINFELVDRKLRKLFDFVVISNGVVFAIETNFFSTPGSKLNEVARSYELLAKQSENIPNFKLIWITDGVGWKRCANGLKLTFNVMDNLYNIKDLKDGIFKEIFK